MWTSNDRRIIRFLLDTIPVQGYIPSKELFEKSKEYGIAFTGIKRLRRLIGVKADKMHDVDGKVKEWVMSLGISKRKELEKDLNLHDRVAKFEANKVVITATPYGWYVEQGGQPKVTFNTWSEVDTWLRKNELDNIHKIFYKGRGKKNGSGS